MPEERIRKLRAKANRTDNVHEAAAYHAKADAIEKNRNLGVQFDSTPPPPRPAPSPAAPTNPGTSSRVSQGTGAWREKATPLFEGHDVSQGNSEQRVRDYNQRASQRLQDFQERQKARAYKRKWGVNPR